VRIEQFREQVHGPGQLGPRGVLVSHFRSAPSRYSAPALSGGGQAWRDHCITRLTCPHPAYPIRLVVGDKSLPQLRMSALMN
jgi:hypothetical protein